MTLTLECRHCAPWRHDVFENDDPDALCRQAEAAGWKEGGICPKGHPGVGGEYKGPTVLYFLGMKPKLEDGTHSSDVRCDCLTQANLRAIVRNGRVVDAGCPVCGKQHACEVTIGCGGRGEISFFPPGITIL